MWMKRLPEIRERHKKLHQWWHHVFVERQMVHNICVDTLSTLTTLYAHCIFQFYSEYADASLFVIQNMSFMNNTQSPWIPKWVDPISQFDTYINTRIFHVNSGFLYLNWLFLSQCNRLFCKGPTNANFQFDIDLFNVIHRECVIESEVPLSLGEVRRWPRQSGRFYKRGSLFHRWCSAKFEVLCLTFLMLLYCTDIMLIMIHRLPESLTSPTRHLCFMPTVSTTCLDPPHLVSRRCDPR